MNDFVSICIPTFKRPWLLRNALDSCLTQSYQNIEILICDNSPEADSRAIVEEIRPSVKIDLRYFQNECSAGQAGNANRLFDEALGDRLLLLHDDDLLLPDAVENLVRCWEDNPELTAAFGKHCLITEEENLLPEATAELNRLYYRTSEYEGNKLSSIESALVQQFPGNGYLVLSEAARRTRYREESELGTPRWCDLDFGIRLALNYDNFFFIDKFCYKYRETAVSVSNSGGTPTFVFPLVNSLELKPAHSWARDLLCKRKLPFELRTHALLGEKRKAFKILMSKYFPHLRLFTPNVLLSLALLITPSFLVLKLLRKSPAKKVG